MQEVSLIEILHAREKRAFLQKKIIKEYNTPLICFTMNIAGPVKVTPLIEKAFFKGVNLLKERLQKIDYESIEVLPTGCVAMFAVDCNAELLKSLCVEIEENFPLGRLFDMDVICPDLTRLQRKEERCCIVCGKSGRKCSAGRVHSVDQLQNTTNQLLLDYFQKEISYLVKESLIYEVNVTPKPGLVDKRNNGSHKDMNIQTFLKSADAIAAYFGRCFSTGYTCDNCFDLLKTAGVEAEKKMFEATEGINTHKGIIYSMGILCAAAGSLLKETTTPDAEQICARAAKIAKADILKSFESITADTAGGRIYLNHGFKGIRGEVLGGFKSVTETSLPCFRELLNNGCSANDAGVLTLLKLISTVDDTCIYNRGGIEAITYAKGKASDALKHNTPEALDDDFISRNISPGGCADLLAVTYFLNKISNDF